MSATTCSDRDECRSTGRGQHQRRRFGGCNLIRAVVEKCARIGGHGTAEHVVEVCTNANKCSQTAVELAGNYDVAAGHDLSQGHRQQPIDELAFERFLGKGVRPERSINARVGHGLPSRWIGRNFPGRICGLEREAGRAHGIGSRIRKSADRVDATAVAGRIGGDGANVPVRVDHTLQHARELTSVVVPPAIGVKRVVTIAAERTWWPADCRGIDKVRLHALNIRLVRGAGLMNRPVGACRRM